MIDVLNINSSVEGFDSDALGDADECCVKERC